MILTCPGCSARYRVKDGLIPPAGKKVKCKKCAVIFRAFPDGRCEKFKSETPSPPAASPPVAPPPQPTATATVRVDAEKIQALVMQQQGVGQDERKPLPEMPENVVVEQKPVQTPVAEPEVVPPPEPEPELRESFTDFREGIPSGGGGVVSEPPAAQKDFFGEVEMPSLEVESGMGDAQAEIASPPPPEEQVSFDLGEPPEKDFQFDAPSDDDPQESALKSELDEFRFELPEEPSPSETPDEPIQDELPDDSFAQPDEQDPFADLAEPGMEPMAMPAQDEGSSQDQEEGSASRDVGFPDIETGELAAPEISQDTAPPEPSPEDISAMPSMDAPSEEPPTQEKFFQAKIDGTLYPKLTADVLERWIKEGRLLESDYLAIEGSGEFKPADQFDVVANLFVRYFGKKEKPVQGTDAKQKKKGFFARMFKK